MIILRSLKDCTAPKVFDGLQIESTWIHQVSFVKLATKPEYINILEH